MPLRGQRLKPGTKETARGRRWRKAVGDSRDESRSKRQERREKLRQDRNVAGPQPSRPAITPLSSPYGVHMRNSSGQPRGTWATYARAAREGARLSKAELARRIGKDRGTIHRWEAGSNRPEDPDVVQAFALALGLDVDEALAAAGLRPGTEPPAEPTREYDEEIELVRTDPRLDEDMKRRIIDLIYARRERNKAAAIEETKRLIDLFGQN